MKSVGVATLDDAEEISRLVNSAYRGDSSRQGWTTEADFLDGQRTDVNSIRAVIGDPKQKLLLLRDPALVGCVTIERMTHDGEPGCYLGMLTIAPDAQDDGHGRFLLTAAENYAREHWQARFVTLSVIQLRESLIAWYERRGYKKNGVTRPFPYGKPEFGMPKRNDLYFVMLEKNI